MQRSEFSMSKSRRKSILLISKNFLYSWLFTGIAITINFFFDFKIFELFSWVGLFLLFIVLMSRAVNVDFPLSKILPFILGFTIFSLAEKANKLFEDDFLSAFCILLPTTMIFLGLIEVLTFRNPKKKVPLVFLTVKLFFISLLVGSVVSFFYLESLKLIILIETIVFISGFFQISELQRIHNGKIQHSESEDIELKEKINLYKTNNYLTFIDFILYPIAKILSKRKVEWEFNSHFFC